MQGSEQLFPGHGTIICPLQIALKILLLLYSVFCCSAPSACCSTGLRVSEFACCWKLLPRYERNFSNMASVHTLWVTQCMGDGVFERSQGPCHTVDNRKDSNLLPAHAMACGRHLLGDFCNWRVLSTLPNSRRLSVELNSTAFCIDAELTDISLYGCLAWSSFSQRLWSEGTPRGRYITISLVFQLI